MRRLTYGIALGLLAVAAAFMLTGHGTPGAWIGVVDGLIVLAALFFERSGYKAELSHPPGPGWEPTGERDRQAEGMVDVWFNPATGERAYVKSRGS